MKLGWLPKRKLLDLLDTNDTAELEILKGCLNNSEGFLGYAECVQRSHRKLLDWQLLEVFMPYFARKCYNSSAEERTLCIKEAEAELDRQRTFFIQEVARSIGKERFTLD